MRILGTLFAGGLLVSLVGCASDDAVTWRLPCNGAGSWQSDAASVFTYRYVYDDLGHLTFEEETAPDGTYLDTYLARYEGDQLVHEEMDGEGAYTYDVVLEGDHQVSATFTDLSDPGGGDYVQTWTWSGDEILGWQRDYATGMDRASTVTYTAEGFTERICVPGACATYTGDEYAHWSWMLLDVATDGVIDSEFRQTRDVHDLLLDYTRDDRDAGGELTRAIQASFDREPDGTATAYDYEVLGTAPDRWHIDYAFSCGSQAQVPAAHGRTMRGGGG